MGRRFCTSSERLFRLRRLSPWALWPGSWLFRDAPQALALLGESAILVTTASPQVLQLSTPGMRLHETGPQGVYTGVKRIQRVSSAHQGVFAILMMVGIHWIHVCSGITWL